ncbi:hypothetical protein COW99_02900 [Candidatus Roizmanbacteria bacterium CG22_combo_CG10-13_8_21_14_all_38_20]|uniref:Thioredoxin domain-containing protein n=1 Tax=Candidatus Roizmanbacteria bacterium CG22_combo_CG10-13_8_21_14_all_38_20 TaxID=1974862 RepID=A0A2H0BVK4_9BACT|nr:MAG: hypothetical protein COW99_02900 [Candidatus Roizmanbacteria bacterium CG22_combo_CG10-13_8_21_14_all_38_20]
MQKILIIIIGIAVIILGTWLFSIAGQNSPTNAKKNGSDFDKFAHITIVDYNGNTVSLEEFKGMPLVINSWAVWCPFCRAELPDFAELQKEFGDRLVVIAIDRQEPLEKAKGYTDELNITNDMIFLLDSSDTFYKSISGFSMPETIFVNSAGEIVVHKRGPMELDEMREYANKIISTNEVSL